MAGTLLALLEPAALVKSTLMVRPDADSGMELIVDVKTFDNGMLSKENEMSRLGRDSVGQDVQQGKGNADKCTQTCMFSNINSWACQAKPVLVYWMK